MDIIAGILYLAGGAGLLFLILHLLDKYGGMSTYSTPRQASRMMNTERTTQAYVNAVQRDNPELYTRAATKIVKKKYAKTYSNMSNEIGKVLDKNPDLKKPIKMFGSSTSKKVTHSDEEKELLKSMEELSKKEEQLKKSIYYTLFMKKNKDSDEKQIELSDGYLNWKEDYQNVQDEFQKLFGEYLKASKKGSLNDILENPFGI